MPWENDSWVGPLPTIEELRAGLAEHGPDHDDPIWCDCCNSEGVALTVCETHDPNRGYELLCQLCILTVTDDKRTDPHFSEESREILKTICVVGNEILKELRRQRPETDPQ